jgi:uncharacterized protein (TIGR02147 family)
MQSDFRRYLQDEFLLRSERNKQYSLRSFSKHLGIGSSDLSKLINQKRRATPKLIHRLASPLNLSRAQVQHFVKYCENPEVEKDNVRFKSLSIDTFRIIADWYHFGILELMKLPNFSTDAHWLGKYLGISPVAVNIAVERLVRVGFLKIDENGVWHDSVGPTTMLSDYKSTKARRQLQNQILDLAKDSLQKVPITEREQSAVIMAIDSSKMAEAKIIINKFRKDMIELLANPAGNKDRLAILNLSLFPVNNALSVETLV